MQLLDVYNPQIGNFAYRGMIRLEHFGPGETDYFNEPFVEERHVVNGVLHRDPVHGPAVTRRGKHFVEYAYYWEGRRHREGGPALIRKRAGSNIAAVEAYYWHGELHRDPDDGPATRYRWPNGRIAEESFYLYGRAFRRPEQGPWFRSLGEDGEELESDLSAPSDLRTMKERLERLAKTHCKQATP